MELEPIHDIQGSMFSQNHIIGVNNRRPRSARINLVFSLRERDFKLIPNHVRILSFGAGSTIQIEEFDPGSE